METETWKPIPNFEGFYEASYCGKIRNCRTGKLLTPRPGRYYHVALQVNGARIDVSWHRMIAITHIPNPENKPEVNHKDGNHFNNHGSNLEWNTRQENVAHSTRNRLHVFGERVNTAVLTLSQVEEIKQRIANGERGASIARIYRVKPDVISKIKTGKTWTQTQQ